MKDDEPDPRGSRMPWPTATIATVRSFYTMRRAQAPRWPVALQAALSIAAPIAVLTLVGQPQLGYQAATGAFTALYATHLRPGERAKVLPVIAVGLVASAAIGVLVGPSVPLTLAGLVAVTVGAGALMYGYRLGPPGPLFFVLVFGVSAHVSAVAPGFDPLSFLIALAAGCLVSYLLVLAPLVLPKVRSEPARGLRELMPRPVWDTEARTLLARVAAVAVVGSVVGIWVDLDRAYWIVSSGVAVVSIALARRVAVSRGLHRLVGTVGGAGLYFLLILVPWAGLWLAALLGTLQFLIELLIVRHYALALLFITPLVLLLTGAASGDIGSASIAAERVVDTAIGAAIGILASLIPRWGTRDRQPAS